MSAEQPTRVEVAIGPVGLVDENRKLASRRSPVARRCLACLAALAVLLGVVSLALAAHGLTAPSVYRIDFLQDYVMAKAIAERADPYLPTRELVERYLDVSVGTHFPHPTPHPPTIGILFLPLTVVDYTTAATVWFVLEIAFLLGSVYLIARSEGFCLAAWQHLAIAVALVAWYPVFEDLSSGQVMLLLLLLLAAARLRLKQGHPLAGGMLVGLAILVKPIPWPLVLLFALKKQWRAFASAVTTISLGYVTASVVIGLDRMMVYATRVLPSVTMGYRAIARNLSLWSVGWRVFDGTQQSVFGGTVLPAIAAPPFVKWPEAAAVVAAGLPALAIVVACLLAWRKCDLDVGFGLMICLGILVSPMSWSNYLVLALIPASQALTWLGRRHPPRRQMLAVLVVAGLMLVPLFVWAILAFLLAGQTPPVSLVGTMPFVPSLLTMAPTMATIALGLLLLRMEESRIL